MKKAIYKLTDKNGKACFYKFEESNLRNDLFVHAEWSLDRIHYSSYGYYDCEHIKNYEFDELCLNELKDYKDSRIELVEKGV